MMRYSSYSFTTSALGGGEWSRPGRALPPGKGPPAPIGEEAAWAPEPVWTQRMEEKFFAPAPAPYSTQYPVQMFNSDTVLAEFLSYRGSVL
jgi:hypothetical protein